MIYRSIEWLICAEPLMLIYHSLQPQPGNRYYIWNWMMDWGIQIVPAHTGMRTAKVSDIRLVMTGNTTLEVYF